MHRNRSISVVVMLLAVVLAFSEVLATVAEDAPYTALPPTGDVEASSTDEPSAGPDAEESSEPVGGEAAPAAEIPWDADAYAEEAQPLEAGPVDSDTGSAIDEDPAEPIEADDAAITSEEAPSEDTDTAEVPVEKNVAPDASAPVPDAIAGDEIIESSPRSTLAQPTVDQKVKASATTVPVSNFSLTCDGILSFDVAAGVTGLIGYGIVANMEDGSSPVVTQGTRTISGTGGTISVAFTPTTNAIAFSAALMDMATQVVIAETTSARCDDAQEEPQIATIEIVSATCDGQVTVLVGEGLADPLLAINFTASGYDDETGHHLIYPDMQILEPISGPGEYTVQFPITGYPDHMDQIWAEVWTNSDVVDLDCSDHALPDHVPQPSEPAWILTEDATCDGKITFTITDGEFVSDLIYVGLFGVDGNRDAVGLMEETWITYTGPGEYTASFEITSFDIDVVPETFTAIYTVSNKWEGRLIETQDGVPNCPSPGYVAPADPVPSPDVDPIHNEPDPEEPATDPVETPEPEEPATEPVETPEPEFYAATSAPTVPEPVQLVASAPDRQTGPAKPEAPAAGVTALPSTGDGTASPQQSVTWLTLAGLALTSGALAIGVRGQQR